MKMEEQRTTQDDFWVCEKCKTRNTSNICSCCGNLRPKKKAPNITVTTGVSSGTQRSGNSDQNTEPVKPDEDRHNSRKGLIVVLAALAIVALFAGVGIICLKSTNGKNVYTAGSIVKFGRYEQDNNLDNGPESIVWTVLDVQEDKALLISKYALDFQPYNKKNTSVTWEVCTLRTWLNSVFLNNAFSDAEQSRILKTTLDNGIEQGKSGKSNGTVGNNTVDRIFLLSKTDAEKYFDSNTARICIPTEYAIKQSMGAASKDSCRWWLRMPQRMFGYVVLTNGYLGEKAKASDEKNAIRPAMWVTIENKDDEKKTALEKNDIHEIGSVVTFGAYEQDNNPHNGSEPIEWIVLDVQKEKSLLISKYVLDCQQYNDNSLDVTWETCTLRQWLNDTFLNDAFSSKEKELIPKVLIPAERNPSYDRDPGKDTNDRVFLLSLKEAERYFDSDQTRKGAPTAYAVAEGAAQRAQTKADEYSCWWWLRSLGGNPNYAARVLSDGTNGQYGDAFKKTGGVRPAIWVDNNSDFFG